MPIIVHKDIAWVKVREHEDKRPMSWLPIDEVWQKSPHDGQSRELRLSVGMVEDRVGLMANSIVMTC